MVGPPALLLTLTAGVAVAAAPGDSTRTLTNNAFAPGESLTYSVGYEFIKAGTTTLRVSESVGAGGRNALRIVSETKSHRFFDPFFKVRDIIETVIDAEGIFPLKFAKRLREGSYSFDYAVDFDQTAHIAYTVRSTKKDTLDIPPFTQDILSAFYYLRTVPLEIGKPLHIVTLDNDKLYPLTVHVHRTERIRVPVGEFDCLVLEPVLQSGGLFKHRGRLTVWVTDDDRRIPIMIRATALIGAIVVKLQRVEGVR